jgi:hypothetical protein
MTRGLRAHLRNQERIGRLCVRREARNLLRYGCSCCLTVRSDDKNKLLDHCARLGKKFTHPDLPNPHVITERVTN